MSYQVLARKYRPQTFDQVIGQDHVTRTLTNALATGRIHHAYLFTGARGIGKTTVARLLAKALNCAKGPAPEPCNDCRSCKEITDCSSLDVQEIDGASNTGVDDVREIRERVRYMPSSGRYKIYIIDEVHMLSTSAFNALLKTLEEPPPHVVFVFATTESHKIPATILSRCQRYDFRRISSSKIAQSLKAIAAAEGIAIDDDALGLIAREASGSLRDGQSLFDQAIAFAGMTVTTKTLEDLLGFLDRRTIFELIGAMTARDGKRALTLLDEAYQTGADLTQLANTVLEMLRHLLIMKVADGGAGAVDLPRSEVDQLKEYAQRLSAEELERMFSIWYVGAEQIARSPFPKMLTEILAVRLCSVTPVKPIADIVARIDELLGTPQEERTAAPAEATPAPPPSKTVAENNPGGRLDWEGFVRWLVQERPQLASVFHHGRLVGSGDDTAEITFDAPLYAEMVTEPDRKKQIDELLKKYFKRSIALSIKSSQSHNKNAAAALRAQQVTKEVLDSPLVKQAAEIFDAKIHDVRTKIEDKE